MTGNTLQLIMRAIIVAPSKLRLPDLSHIPQNNHPIIVFGVKTDISNLVTTLKQLYHQPYYHFLRLTINIQAGSP